MSSTSRTFLAEFLDIVVNTNGGAQQAYTVIILGLTTMFLYADQNILAPNLTMIAEEFDMNEKERDTKLGKYCKFGKLFN